MQAWQIERIRDRVDELGGRASLRICTASGTSYKIWYNSRDDVSLFGRIEWDKNERRDHLIKAYLQEVVEAINSQRAQVLVQYKDDSAWFADGDEEMRPLAELYDYIIALKVDEDNTDIDQSDNCDGEDDREE